MQHLKDYNDGVRYILVLRNCFTKHVSVVGYLQDKTAVETARVFEYMLTTQVKYICHPLVTDSGAEFLNSEFKAVCAKYDIKMYQPKTGKAVHAENAILYLKTKLYRYSRDTNNYRYIEILPYIVKNYNSSVRHVLGTTPDLVNRPNEFQIFHRQFGRHLPRKENIKPKFKVGDYVRLRVAVRTFEKSYFHKYTAQMYKIISVLLISQPPKYNIVAYNNPSDTWRVLERDLPIVPQNVPTTPIHCSEPPSVLCRD